MKLIELIKSFIEEYNLDEYSELILFLLIIVFIISHVFKNLNSIVYYFPKKSAKIKEKLEIYKDSKNLLSNAQSSLIKMSLSTEAFKTISNLPFENSELENHHKSLIKLSEKLGNRGFVKISNHLKFNDKSIKISFRKDLLFIVLFYSFTYLPAFISFVILSLYYVFTNQGTLLMFILYLMTLITGLILVDGVHLIKVFFRTKKILKDLDEGSQNTNKDKSLNH